MIKTTLVLFLRQFEKINALFHTLNLNISVRIIILLLSMSCLSSVLAQPVNTSPNKTSTVLPSIDTPLLSTGFSTQTTIKPSSFEEYLVQLTWKNSPELEGSGYEIEARKQEIMLAKKDWTRNLQAAVNFNDVSLPYFLVNTIGTDKFLGKKIDLTKLPSVATYPVWNIGIGVNFGDLIIRKYKVRYAENKKKLTETEQNFKKQKLRGEILKRYQEYLSSRDILKIRLQALDAAEANKTQIASLFSVNKAKFEDYNTANKAYFDALESKVRGESDIRLKKIAIEELIGFKWEQVERIQASYEK